MKPIMEGWRGYLSEQEKSDISKFVDDVLADIQKSGLADYAKLKTQKGKQAEITNTGTRQNRKNIIAQNIQNETLISELVESFVER